MFLLIEGCVLFREAGHCGHHLQLWLCILSTYTCGCVFYQLTIVAVYSINLQLWQCILSTYNCGCVFYQLQLWLCILSTYNCGCVFYQLTSVAVYSINLQLWLCILSTSLPTPDHLFWRPSVDAPGIPVKIRTP